MRTLLIALLFVGCGSDEPKCEKKQRIEARSPGEVDHHRPPYFKPIPKRTPAPKWTPPPPIVQKPQQQQQQQQPQQQQQQQDDGTRYRCRCGKVITVCTKADLLNHCYLIHGG